MVEKRRSPDAARDSPPEAQRRKTLTDLQPMDVDASGASPRASSTRTRVNSCATDLEPTEPIQALDPSMLSLRHRFAVVDFIRDRVMSPTIKDAQGADWRVVWHPRSPTDEKFVGIFVELVTQPEDQKLRPAELTIALLNQAELPHIVKHTSVHLFSWEDPEFGMSQFYPRRELLNPSNRFLTEDGQVEVEVRLSFVEQELEQQPDVVPLSQDADNSMPTTLETTQHLLSYDSKEETGMVGLKNQGATCYLNSLLQTLFHLRAFRQVVYETPTAQEDTNDSVSLALQRVFYRLQRQHKAVSTKELTRSFGWSQIDSFMQHDVQELYRILCDRLEEKMKHTRVDAAIPKLFEGKVRSFVQCVNVDFQSFRDESFYDLQLDVKGCKDLMQSFRKYVEVEMLDGDNQYEAEGHGKQDAKKGIEFLTFPPVLNIQLKRFEYDPMRDGMVKIHDRFEFPKTLVLDEFIPEGDGGRAGDGKDEAPRLIYHLHSVLVHSGDVHGGHYYVFIRPGKHIAPSTDWFRFDDDQITRVDEHTAVEGNFGSAGAPATPQEEFAEPPFTAPPSPLYSSDLGCPPDQSASEQSAMDGLEFRSVDAGAVPSADNDHAGSEAYDYSQSNGTSSLSLESNSFLMPIGRSHSSAYMLVYVRDGENDISAIREAAATGVEADITPSPSSEDISMAGGESSAHSSADADLSLPSWQSDPLPIPEELVTRFHEEEKAAARRKKAQQTEHLYMTVRIASDVSVAKLKRISKQLDFAQFNNANTMRVRIKRAASIRQLYRRIYKETGVPMARQRLWKVITRENRTTRPDLPIGPDAYDCRVESLVEDDASPKTPVKLYLQILNESCVSSSQATASPPASPSSPSVHPHAVGKRHTGPATEIHRHFWDEFAPPELEDAAPTEEKPSQEMGQDDEDAAAAFAEASENLTVDHAPPLHGHEIMLFIKFYDLKRKLGERLEYVGNVVVDSRITGAELAERLHEALSIPSSTELRLYEEIQPTSVPEVDMEATLTSSELQHGDIICFQFAEDEEQASGLVLQPDLGVEEDPDAAETTYIGPDGQEVKAVISPNTDEANETGQTSRGGHRKRALERYPDVRSYFRYLLDRVDVTFHRYGHGEEDAFTISLLFSNVYDEVIDAVASHLGLLGPKRLYVRLYQHSPLNSLPMKAPLRHSRYSEDSQTTLEDLLTEYTERTTVMYYELLDHPITEIEAKKELLVHLSIYDACFATEQAASPSPVAPQRHIEVLVMPTHKVRDLLSLIRDGFALPEETPLRACEVVQHGAMIQRLLEDDTPLSRYWGSGVATNPNTPEILVEQIPAYELLPDPEVSMKESSVKQETSAAADAEVVIENDASEQPRSGGSSPVESKDVMADDGRPAWFFKGVVHFNFQSSSQKWIHPHGVPCVVRFSEHDTVGEVKERIRQR
jgi:ubiquitin C-terminal hydrolase